MKSGLLAVVAGMTMALAVAAPAHALDLFGNDFDSEVPGFLPTGWYSFSGTGSGGETMTFTPEVSASGGVGGTQGMGYSMDYTFVDPEIMTYWFAGVGSYAVYASDIDLRAGGVDGSDDPSRYRFSVDIKVTGNNGDTEAAIPVGFLVSLYDDDWDTVNGLDGNDNGMVDGADVYTAEYKPTLVDMGDYVTATFTLDQGTIDKNVNVPAPAFDNTSVMFLSMYWNGGGFGLDTGNTISMDNLLLEFIEEVPDGLDGDYNGNDVIDAADYTVWRDALTAGSTSLTNDPTPGVVDESDFDYWRTHFGETMGAGAGSGSAVVPEPTSLSLFSVLAMCLFGARSWRRRAGA